MFKVNVVGTLRTARVFLPLLKNAKGRLLTIGLTGECYNGTGVVAYAAARHAVAGASNALSNELAHLGVNVVTINTGTITADALYHQVRVRVEEQIEPNVQPTDPYLRYKVNALPRYALRIIEQILLSDIPKLSYDLVPPVGLSIYFTAISEKFNSNKQPAPLNTV
ncbi:hypothetical protein AAG570_008461 [Ranatra chinensis]|uniref:Uncharacterized protein n=1 Tax=Ranatra chinensis TaxID=642074 RepID=A0ABD0Z3W0_9HEMI